MISRSRRQALYVAIGQRISKIRQERELTQAELAAAISLSRTSVTNIESGRQKILVHTLVEIASALRVRVEELLLETMTTKETSVKKELLEGMDEVDRKFIADLVGPYIGEEES